MIVAQKFEVNLRKGDRRFDKLFKKNLVKLQQDLKISSEWQHDF